MIPKMIDFVFDELTFCNTYSHQDFFYLCKKKKKKKKKKECTNKIKRKFWIYPKHKD